MEIRWDWGLRGEKHARWRQPGGAVAELVGGNISGLCQRNSTFAWSHCEMMVLPIGCVANVYMDPLRCLRGPHRHVTLDPVYAIRVLRSPPPKFRANKTRTPHIRCLLKTTHVY